jgi:hypothetical protein
MGRDANDILREGGPDAIGELLARAKPYKAKKEPKPNGHANGAHAHEALDKGIDKALDEIDAWVRKPSFWESEAEEPEIDWLVQDLLPAAGAGLLAGQWGMSKTFVVLDLAAALGEGAAAWARWREERGLPADWRYSDSRGKGGRITAAQWLAEHGPTKPEGEGE